MSNELKTTVSFAPDARFAEDEEMVQMFLFEKVTITLFKDKSFMVGGDPEITRFTEQLLICLGYKENTNDKNYGLHRSCIDIDSNSAELKYYCVEIFDFGNIKE